MNYEDFTQKSPGEGDQTNHGINPLAGISGAINRPLSPTTAPAASLPLRAAPSIVDGHSVAVQSPARKNPGQSVWAPGRNRSSPGTTEKVARASFSTPFFTNFARFTSGKNIANSRRAEDRISSLVMP